MGKQKADEAKFKEKVFEAVRSIPRGKVATYSDIAKKAGSPAAARAVGNILHTNCDKLGTPCYRVVNSMGKLSQNYAFGGVEEQAWLLECDGIEISDFKVDLTKYRI